MLNNKSVSWLFIIVVLAFATCQDGGEDSACKNFEGTTCELLSNCPYVRNFINKDEIDKVIIRTCSFEGTEPKVCCPKDVKGSKENAIIFNDKNENEPSATKRPTAADNISNKVYTTLPPTTTTPYPDPFPNRSICGQVKTDDKIIGGQPAGIDEFPWLAQLSIIYTLSERYGCAGSLITDRHVLTAAHCVYKNNVSHVRLGEYNVNTEEDCVENECNDKPVNVDVKRVLVHEKYDDKDIARYDIAILVLKHPVNFTDFIQPVCLPTTEYVAVQDYLKSSTYLTAGWGLTEYDDSSPVKRKLRLNAVPLETCRVAFESMHISVSSDSDIICAGGRKNEDSCRGDSGGSLVRDVTEDYRFNWYLYGITSFGARKCGKEGVPGAYTRVTAYMDWIKKKVSST